MRPKPTPDPNATQDPDATAAPNPNLCPAQPGANPLDLLAWLFTPIFQTIFIGLAFLYSITGDIGIAIILLTIIIRTLHDPDLPDADRVATAHADAATGAEGDPDQVQG